MLKQVILVIAALIKPSIYGQAPETRFWNWFQSHESELRAVVTGREPICAQLAAQLHKIHPDLVYEFGPVQSGRREFVLSADGIRDAFPAVLSLAAAAPSLDRWTIVRFRPARRDVTRVSIGGVELDAASVQFHAKREGDKTNLTISVPGYKPTPTSTYEQAVYLLLDRMLGEYAVETSVGSIEIIASEGRPKGDWRPLTRVHEAVKTEPIN